MWLVCSDLFYCKTLKCGIVKKTFQSQNTVLYNFEEEILENSIGLALNGVVDLTKDRRPGGMCL